MDNNSSDNFIPAAGPAPELPEAPLGDDKSQLVDKLKNANNILVTVSRNPSVDQLAACIGLTLLLNKMNKHAAAVFSGEVPSTLEFLKPDETLEKNTDSLRDFIIALDKSKAAKLRYKVENDVVRIFITPYRTSISQEDLDFSQGDFNVDLVLGLGVQNQDDLDEVITENGRILHDATVATINTTADGGLGSLNWHDSTASSLSELATELAEDLNKGMIDNQIANAFLTGIVAETERFRNAKTTPRTMTTSSVLMAAGANQQLVASELDKPPEQGDDFGDEDQNIDHDEPSDSPEGSGNIEIDHDETGAEPLPEADVQPPAGPSLPEITPEPPAETPPEPPTAPEITPFNTTPLEAVPPPTPAGSGVVIQPPQNGGTLTANAAPEPLDPLTDPLSLASLQQHHLLVTPPSDAAQTPPSEPVAAVPLTPAPEPVAAVPASPMHEPVGFNPPGPDQTLVDLENSVQSPHAAAAVADARDQVAQALADTSAAPVTPVVQPVSDPSQAPASDMSFDPTAMGITTEAAPPVPTEPAPMGTIQPSSAAPTPPPVPPPIPFQFGAPPSTPGV